MGKKLTLEEKTERFKSNVVVTPYCWYWRGSLNNCGYGQGNSIWSHIIPAHRTAYTLWVGEIPQGFQIDHLCNTRNCVNPNHLEAVTKRENARRMVERKGWTHGGKKYEPRYMIGVAAKPLTNLLKRGECFQGHKIASKDDLLIYPQEDGRVKHICKACKKVLRKNEKNRGKPSTSKKPKVVPKPKVKKSPKPRGTNPKSGYPNVYWDVPRETWVGKVNRKGKTYYIGSSDDPRVCSEMVEKWKQATPHPEPTSKRAHPSLNRN